MKIVWSPTAQNRVREILDYIAKDDPDMAVSFIDSMEAKVNKLLQNPGSGRPIPEIQGSSIRELIVHKNYSVIYEICADSLEVLTVRHFKQNFDF